jgi:N-formylglutamate deformylase
LKKKKQLPILVVIPHGGVNVPEEVAGYEAVSGFDLFFQSDSCANDLFNFNEKTACTINTDISRLFIDLDRPYTVLPPARDGVIKKTTLYGKPVYNDGVFPDEIAIANMLQRYYFPFHDAIQKTIDTGSIKIIMVCHTMMAVGPTISPDPGEPRPIVSLEHIIENNDGVIETCSEALALSLLEYMKKSLAKENGTIAQKYTIKTTAGDGHILKKFGTGEVPVVRLSITRALFLNDKYFSYDYMRVDELRIRHLKGLLWSAIEKFYSKNFT